MKINIILLAGLLMAMVACKTDSKDTSTTAKQEETATQANKKTFGAEISDKGAISYDQLLTQMEGQEEVEATIIAKVTSVCQTKGCWMTVQSDNSTEEMFVQFKDYGFFMPADIAGKEVVMRGKAFTEETTVDELRHYAEDEGQTAEEIAAITEPVVELKFLADGVIIRD